MDALPVELVSSIFHWVVHTPAPSSPSRDSYRRALKLSHISSRLREIAIACPSLWTSISTTHDAHHTDTTTCLARSKACALDIHFDTHRIPHHKVTSISRDLVAHAERWRDAELRYHEHAPAEEIVRLLDAAFVGGGRELRSLCVTLPRSVGTARVVSPPVAPALERLSLENLGFNWHAAAFPALKELRLAGINGPEAPSLAQFASLLENAPALELVCLKDVMPHAAEEEVNPVVGAAAENFDNTISLPGLTSITFDGVCLSLVHLVLTRVSAPALSRLAIQANNAPLNLDWSSVRRDTLAEVQSFQWNSWTEGTDAHGLRIAAMFRAVINALASVQDVTLGGGLAVREVALQDQHDESARMPRMRAVEFTGLKGCDMEMLVSLVRNRAAKGLERMDRLSFSAGDFSTTASVGQRAMEVVDEALDSLKASVGKLDVRDRPEGTGFRYTFLGWRDYRDYQSRGRQWEYDMEYEE